jgi:hypothetical protein
MTADWQNLAARLSNSKEQRSGIWIFKGAGCGFLSNLEEREGAATWSSEV